jgi:hypothetical protein
MNKETLQLLRDALDIDYEYQELLPEIQDLVVRERIETCLQISEETNEKVWLAYNKYNNLEEGQRKYRTAQKESNFWDELADKIERVVTKALEPSKKKNPSTQDQGPFSMCSSIEHAEKLLPLREAVAGLRRDARKLDRLAYDTDPRLDQNQSGGRRSNKALAHFWLELVGIGKIDEIKEKDSDIFAYKVMRTIFPGFDELDYIDKRISSEGLDPANPSQMIKEFYRLCANYTL